MEMTALEKRWAEEAVEKAAAEASAAEAAKIEALSRSLDSQVVLITAQR